MTEAALDFEKTAEDERAEVWTAVTNRTLTPKTVEEITDLFKGQKLEALSNGSSEITVRVLKKGGKDA